MKNLAVIALALVISLSSCVVGKKYTRTRLELPGSYRAPVELTSDTVALPWKTFFNDPLLTDLVNKALAKNNDVLIALKSVDQLDLAYRQARLGLLPTLQANLGAARTWPSQNSLNGSLTEQFIGTKYMDDYGASLSLSWEADIWGKVKMQKDAARANYFSQRENFLALQTRIISQVAQAYYNLISLDQQLAFARRNVAMSDTMLRATRLQFNAGIATSVAVEQAQAQKTTAELLIPLALQNIAVQENALSILCGDYPDKIARTTSMSLNGLDAMEMVTVPATLLSRRPDVRAAEYTVIAANARTGQARAAMYPSISLTPQIGVNSFRFNNWFDLPGSLTKTLAANLMQPIFQGKALRTAYQTAALEQEKAALQFKQTVLNAVAEVSDALAQINGSRERLTLLQKRSAALDKATHDALLLFKSGMASYLEVITAQNSKLVNDQEVVNVQLEQLTAHTNLYRALGGGIQ